MGHILVGIDGSPASLEALRWALDHAHLRKDTVEVIHVWCYPALALDPPHRRELTQAALSILDKALHEVGASAAGVPVRRTVVEGTPADRLIARAQDADLLVVGARGIGGFEALLLGSVSEQCARHAPCPVVIVRARPERA